jgi:hypothetical protein
MHNFLLHLNNKYNTQYTCCGEETTVSMHHNLKIQSKQPHTNTNKK